MSADILIIDDNATNLLLLEHLMEVSGHVAYAADGPASALQWLQQHRPRVILMDLQMPGVDGYELTRRIRARPDLAGVRIIAVTSYAMAGDDQRALAAGCDDYVTKPIDPRSLPAVVARHLAAASG